MATLVKAGKDHRHPSGNNNVKTRGLGLAQWGPAIYWSATSDKLTAYLLKSADFKWCSQYTPVRVFYGTCDVSTLGGKPKVYDALNYLAVRSRLLGSHGEMPDLKLGPRGNRVNIGSGANIAVEALGSGEDQVPLLNPILSHTLKRKIHFVAITNTQSDVVMKDQTYIKQWSKDLGNSVTLGQIVSEFFWEIKFK